jgi:hypothetical protein
MKKLSLFLATFILNVNSYGAGCSYGLLDSFTFGNGITVNYEEQGQATGIVPSTEPYPDINEINDCIVSFGVYAAPETCRSLFTRAQTFATAVNDPDWSGVVFVGKMSYTVALSVVEYFKNFSTPTIGGYFSDLAISGSVGGTPAGFTDFYNKLTAVTEACGEVSGVPVHKTPDFDPLSADGMAIVDVFKNSVQLCTFVTSIKNSQIRIEVPKQYYQCVKSGDSFVTRINQRHTGTGLLVTKTALGGPDEFVATSKDAPYKAVASETNNVLVSSLMDSLDLGASAVNLSSVAKLEDINFDDVSSLDPTILKIVAMCDWGVSSATYEADYALFLVDWMNMSDDVVSFVDGNVGGYYRAVYYQQLVHSQTFPKLKKLHEYVKSGAITGAQLGSWQGNALAVCYMNYPLTKVPVNIVEDYIK